MDDDEFVKWYGAWEPWAPGDVAEVLSGWSGQWWIAGGWSLDAYTGTSRTHEDIDVAVFRRDVPALRAHLASTHHCWAVGSGGLRPLTAEEPHLPEWADQCWVREHACAPWRADFVTGPDRDGEWVFRRDPTVTIPLSEVVWRDAGGVAFQRPEITLAWKAKLSRAKDDVDFDRTWPRLDARARDWLRDTVTRLHPDHPWLVRMRQSSRRPIRPR